MSDLEVKIDRVSTRAFLKALGGGAHGKKGPARAKIIARLRLTPGAIVTFPELIEFLWGDREDGGPLTPERNIQVHVCRLRKRGFPIEGCWGEGLRWIEGEMMPRRKFSSGPKFARSEYLAAARGRQNAALAMLRSGLLYRQIADRLGFASDASAWAAVRTAKRREELHQHRKAA